MLGFSSDSLISIFALAIPIIAIIGGITAGIVKTIGQQRLAELAHRERIAALERGVDPSKLPPAPVIDFGPGYGVYNPMRRYHGLLIGGVVCAVAGLSISAFLLIMETQKNAWAVGLIPMGIGVALLLSAILVKPRNGGAGSVPPPGY